MPEGVVTETIPVAPLPTTAVIVVLLSTVNELTVTPPIFTIVAPVKFVPVIITEVPAPPTFGENDVIVGIKRCVNKLVDDAVPDGVVIDITPDVPLPIIALMLVALSTVNKLALVPPNFTLVVPIKLVPVIITTVPVIPLDGVKDIIVVGDKIVIVKVWRN